MKRYAAVWLLVLMMASGNISADRYIVCITPGIARGDCIGYPLVFDHKPSEFEVFVASNFPRAYKAYPLFMRVCDSVEGVTQKILLMSEEAAKYKH